MYSWILLLLGRVEKSMFFRWRDGASKTRKIEPWNAQERGNNECGTVKRDLTRPGPMAQRILYHIFKIWLSVFWRYCWPAM